MTRSKTLRRLDTTEADTLKAICDWLDVQQAQGKLLYIRHQPPMMTSKRIDGKTKVIFKKVRESQLGAADVIIFRKIIDAGNKEGYSFEYEFTDILCIEVKSAKGNLSLDQVKWRIKANNQGMRYILARSLDDIIKAVK